MKVDLDKIPKEDLETALGLIDECKDFIRDKSYNGMYDWLSDQLKDNLISSRFIGYVTSVLYASGVDPLKYVEQVPLCFLAESQCILGDFIIPNNIWSIGSFAFDNCDNLQSVNISGGVTVIGPFAFAECKRMEKIIFPDTLTKINRSAVAGCEKLNLIIFKGTKLQWESISKTETWDVNTGKYIIKCTDGDIKK